MRLKVKDAVTLVCLAQSSFVGRGWGQEDQEVAKITKCERAYG